MTESGLYLNWRPVFEDLKTGFMQERQTGFPYEFQANGKVLFGRMINPENLVDAVKSGSRI